MSELRHVPRSLLSLAQWDAVELDPTRRRGLNAGTLIMSPGPHPRHQPMLKRLTRLLDDHVPAELEAVPAIEVTTSASFPPSVREPEIVVIPKRLFDRHPGLTDWRLSRLLLAVDS